MQKLEEYSKDFESWFSANEELIRQKSPVINAEELEELVQKHEAVVNKTEQLKSEVPGAIKELKIKGKGIRAYTDVLPKKISLGKPHKG